MNDRLAVHGFVLAGGKSTRMGEDKALTQFCGTPMIELAVKKLCGFCAEVGIAGNREDLACYAPVVHEVRLESGPAAGIEAALMVASQPWVLFIPVDVPLAPMGVLHRWVASVIEADEDERSSGSYLLVGGLPQPAFCLLRRECLTAWSGLLNEGERRLACLLREIRVQGRSAVNAVAAERFVTVAEPESTEMAYRFSNINTPLELAAVEAAALDRYRKPGRERE